MTSHRSHRRFVRVSAATVVLAISSVALGQTAADKEQAKALRSQVATSDLRKGVILAAVGLSFIAYSMFDDRSPNWVGLVLLFLSLAFGSNSANGEGTNFTGLYLALLTLLAATDLADTREALDHLAMQLAAVTGAQTDRMTRDDGWRLLSIGRHIEREFAVKPCVPTKASVMFVGTAAATVTGTLPAPLQRLAQPEPPQDAPGHLVKGVRCGCRGIMSCAWKRGRGRRRRRESGRDRRVEGGAGFEHGAGDVEKTVADGAQSTGMAATAGLQSKILGFALLIAPPGSVSQVVNRVPLQASLRVTARLLPDRRVTGATPHNLRKMG